MRPVADIDADIAATEAKLRALHAERRGAFKARSSLIVAEFDGGKDIADISEARGMSYSTVQGILFRAGRTQTGRMVMRARLGLEGPRPQA